MSQAIRCSCCGGSNVLGPYQLANFESYVRIPDGVDGAMTRRELKLSADRARVCGDCGHLMHFVDANKLRG